ncbi:uncharacterized protein LOC111272313 isoform X2 [Varroa jacobsoni]|uniref:Uncharacterized protein n=1 Tax=Varroa destructor TaxID=109461 RepID=A0A7M7MJD4_VARDE|nr:uncharacterized protein LOC111254321 isoform X2 [Varroa destructor]XP_022709439.1 uncharacterized protein LOC111272313 isoform X2 [Varroa jacobsoni]
MENHSNPKQTLQMSTSSKRDDHLNPPGNISLRMASANPRIQNLIVQTLPNLQSNAMNILDDVDVCKSMEEKQLTGVQQSIMHTDWAVKKLRAWLKSTELTAQERQVISRLIGTVIAGKHNLIRMQLRFRDLYNKLRETHEEFKSWVMTIDLTTEDPTVYSSISDTWMEYRVQTLCIKSQLDDLYNLIRKDLLSVKVIHLFEKYGLLESFPEDLNQ